MTLMERGQFLILCKTYPSPSAKYIETCCVAAMTAEGDLIRLFPIPFRDLEANGQFRKWQWIEAVVKKSGDDHRPESYKISVDTILPREALGTGGEWKLRLQHLDQLKLFTRFSDIEHEQMQNSTSLALLKPDRIEHLEIKPSRPDWTEEEKQKLIQENKIGNLFDEPDTKGKTQKLLNKIPYDFYYHYICIDSNGIEVRHHHKIIDWEVGALFWNCYYKDKINWEKPFRAKLEAEMRTKDIYFLLGNMHRFQKQWLIISLIYPPKRQTQQPSLF